MYYQIVASFTNEEEAKKAYQVITLLEKSEAIDVRGIALISHAKRYLNLTQKTLTTMISLFFGLLCFIVLAFAQRYIEAIIIGLTMFFFNLVLFQSNGFDVAVESASLKLNAKQSGLLIWTHTQAVVLTEYLAEYGGLVVEVIQRV